MQAFSELSSTAQTAYAQMVEAALGVEHARSVADLSGSFSAKQVKGHKYWYYQYTEPAGKLRQVFVGPDSDPVRALVARKNASAQAVNAPLAPLARSAIALGCAEVLPKHFKVLKRLSEYGFFNAGGVLVGTHAFIAFGNMLGVRWGDAAQTQDIDFAHAGKSMALALAPDFEVHTQEAIESLNMGFLPIAGLAGKGGATYLNPREPDFRLDFLTTLHRGGDRPYEHPQLHVTLQPLKFMEFSLEQVQQVALLANSGSLIVNVPHPARFALHKLVVAGERSGTFQAKAAKDLRQAGALLEVLRELRPWDVEEAWQDLLGRGPGWIARARHSLAMLDKLFPALQVREWLKVADNASEAV
jgi:hypothetical protein